MVFVREVISDQDKEKIGAISSPAGGPIYLTSWLADRERDAFLVWGSQDRDPPHHSFFVLLIGSVRFRIEMTIKYERTNLGYDYEYLLHKIVHFADGLQEPKDAFPILKEALRARSAEVGPTHSIKFDF